MASDAKTRRLDCGGAEVDRISNLPRNIIDLILERLPIHDAARTSILSKTWRDLWGLYPNLVFDDAFFSRLVSDKDEEDQLLKVTKTISDILLVNRGPVFKFHLSVPEDLLLNQSRHMDLWIRNISNQGVRQLVLFNEPTTDYYKMPSYLFSCSELTHFSLSNCILNPPVRFGGFCNLIEVELKEVIITRDMSFGTHLEVLKLTYCAGIKHLESQFKQNNLIHLVIIKSGKIDCTWFQCTKKVQTFGLMMLERVANSRKICINLDKLVGDMHEIRSLRFNGSFLKLLDPSAAVSKRLITTMKNLNSLFLSEVEFYDLVQIQYVLLLMRSSPKQRFLYIKVKTEVQSADGMDLAASREVMMASVVHYLKFPNFMDMVFDHLKTVEIHGMVGSRAELEFIKFLLASSPFLESIILLNTAVNDPKEESRISRVLMQFPRASTAAQIIWT